MASSFCVLLDFFQVVWSARGYIFAALMIVLGLKFMSSRIITWFYVVYFWILIGLNTVSADYGAYREMYECCFADRYNSHEIGYMTLCKLFYSIGIPFEIFRAVIGSIVVYLLVTGIKKLTDKPNFVFALMLIFPFVSFVSGLRNSLSMAIIIHGFYYLLDDTVGGDNRTVSHRFRLKNSSYSFYGLRRNAKLNTVIFVFHILIACLFHYASVFYFVFLYAKHYKKNTVSLMIQVVVIIVAAVGLSRAGFVYNIIRKYTTREKTLAWFSANSSGVSISVLYLVAISLLGIMLFVLYYCKWLYNYSKTCVDCRCILFSSNDINTVLRIVIVSLLAFSGAVFSSVVFLRLVLTPIPLAYCVFSKNLFSYKGYDYERHTSVTRVRLFVYLFVIIVALFVFGYWIGGNSLTMYANNLVFQ